MFPSLDTLSVWNKNGITAAVALHVAISEPLFYTLHRCFHGDYLFTHYHYLHHSSPVPQPLTGKIIEGNLICSLPMNIYLKSPFINQLMCANFAAGHATFLEHLLLTVVVAVPIIGSFMMGLGSIYLIYGYILLFDLLRYLGHSNVEIVPHQIFDAAPFFKYLLYTQT